MIAASPKSPARGRVSGAANEPLFKQQQDRHLAPTTKRISDRARRKLVRSSVIPLPSRAAFFARGTPLLEW